MQNQYRSIGKSLLENRVFIIPTINYFVHLQRSIYLEEHSRSKFKCKSQGISLKVYL